MSIYQPKYLSECISYDPDSGSLFWKVRPLAHFRTIRGWRCFNSRESGTLCGAIQPTGYIAFRMDQQLFLAHRVAWVLGTNMEIPEGMLIDHINGDKADNKLSNLRLATRSENGRNSKKSVRNTLPKGVCLNKKNGRYVAIVGLDGIYNRAQFDTVEDADAQARAWRQNLHGQFANHGDDDAA